MKYLFFVAAIAALQFPAVSHAQQVDDLGDLVVNVTPHITWAAGAGGAQAQVYCYGRTGAQWTNVGGTNGTTTDLPQQSVRMVPGVTYSAAFNVTNSSAGPGATGFDLTVHAPPGYSVEMMAQVSGFTVPFTPGNDFSGVFPNDGAQTHTANVSIRVVAPGSGAGIGPGLATSLRPGWIAWSMSLGALRSGLPAGTLYFNLGSKTIDFTTAFSRNNISCDSTASDVLVLGDSANASTVRQVVAPQVVVDITGALNSGNIQINCYHPSQCSATVGADGFFTFTGSPYLAYTVQPTDPNDVKISCNTYNTTATTVGTIARTLTTSLSRSGTYPSLTWTAAAWYSGTTPLVETVRARYGTTETVNVQDNNSVVAATVTNTYTSMLGDEEITQQQVGSTGSNPVTTSYSYYTSDTTAGGYGWEQLETRNDGSWQGFEYASNGTLQMVHTPWNNVSSAGFPSDTAAHAALTFSADAFGELVRPASSTSTINGTTVGQSSTTYSNITPFNAYTSSHPSLTVVQAVRTDNASASSSLTTTTKTFAENAGVPQPGNAFSSNDDFYRYLPYSSERPDKVKQDFVQQRGTWDGTTFTISGNAGLDPVLSNGEEVSATRTTVVTGSSDSSAGTAYSRTDGYPADTLYLVDKKSTLEITIRNQYGDVVHTETQAWLSNAWNVVASTNYAYNLAHQLTNRTNNLNGATFTAQYSGEQKSGETDESGISVSYTYDADDRVVTSTVAAARTLPGALTTQFTYDAAGHVTTKTVGYGQSETLVSNARYDDAGRLTSQQDPGVNATTISYDPVNHTVTTTLPTGGTKIETYNYDGTVASVTSSNGAVVNQYYAHQVLQDGTGNIQKTVSQGTQGGPRTQSATSDWLGRTFSTSRPGFTGQPAFVEQANFGGVTGRLLSTVRTAGTNSATTYYKYDVLGQVISNGLHVDGTQTMATADGAVNIPTPASNDRMSDSDSYFESYQGAFWMTKTASAYPISGNGTPLLVSTVRTRLTNFGTGVLSETLSTDINNIGTDQVTTAASGVVTVTTTVKDTNNVTLYTATEKTANGLPTSVTRFDGLTYTTSYDVLYRKLSVNDPRAGNTTYAYYSGTGLVSSVTDAASNPVARYSYDSAGRVIVTTDAAGHATRDEYNNLNQVVHQWGDGTYPVEYVYDSTYGDRLELHTFQGTDASGGNFAETSWPGGTPTSVTKWVYDAPSGLVSSKTDAANKSVTYGYNFRGQILTRTWARNVTTTYGYDSITGELTGVSYSDSTNPLTYSYTRAGQLYQVTDATGTRTFTYGQSGASPNTNPLQLDSITLPTSSTYPSGFYGPRVLTRKYDNTGRGAGFVLGSAFNSASDLSQVYTYNSQARFDHLVVSNAADTTARTFTYSYNNGGLVSGMGVSGTLGSAGAFGVTMGYETHRNLLTSISTAVGTTVVSEHDYVYNALGQRQTAQQSGSAFSDIGTTTYNNGYNERGELKSSADYIGGSANIGTGADQMSDRNFYYTYDNIGNRTASSRHGPPTGNPISNPTDSYVVNNLNQYQSRTNLYAEAAGAVSANTNSVTVSNGGQPWALTGKQGQYWAADLEPGTTPQAIPLTITATGTFNSTSYQRTDTSKTIYFPGNQTFQYDADGNLLSDGIWSYTYDAENRLISMTSTVGGFQAKYLDFTYDYLGRRVQKHSNNTTTGTQTWRRYIYDGDNLVAELDVAGGNGTLTLVRSYAWGLDMAGSLTATGGVGALIQITNHTGTIASYFPTYDGNGNITSLVNAGTGSVAVSYEYSPFGEVLRRGGATYNGADSAILDNPFAFSTKFTDWESGLVYYGHRYYSPSLGRFINRDPIEEGGGLNLYGFCGNDGTNRIDVLGHSWFSKVWKKIWKPLVAIAAGVLTAGLGMMAFAAVEGGTFIGGLGAAISSVGLAAGWGPAWAAVAAGGFGFGTGFVGARLNGASTAQALRVGLKAGVTAAATAYVSAGIREGYEDWKYDRMQFYRVTADPNRAGQYLPPERIWDSSEIDGKQNIFVNGIVNPVSDATLNGERFFNGQSFMLGYNPTHGFWADITETGLGKLTGTSSLGNDLADVLSRIDPNGSQLFLHSQGAQIGINAVQKLVAKGVDLAGMSVSGYGGATNLFTSRAIVAASGARWAGWTLNAFDAVPNIVGLDSIIAPQRFITSLIASPFLFANGRYSPHSSVTGTGKSFWSLFNSTY